MSTFFYCTYPNLPKIPAKLTELALSKSAECSSTHPSVNINRQLYVNGESMPTRFSTTIPLPEEVQCWINDNITNTWDSSNLHVSKGTSPVHGAHTDVSRKYVLIYLLDTSNVDQRTVWYQENGFELARQPNTYQDNFDKLTKIDEIIIPINTWVLLDTTILHSIENILNHRIAVHMGFFEDPRTMLADIKC